ncbi:MAG: hypothetical protein ACK5RH_07665 [Burkholderiales bacterium]
MFWFQSFFGYGFLLSLLALSAFYFRGGRMRADLFFKRTSYLLLCLSEKMHKLVLALVLTLLSSCTTVSSSEYTVHNISQNEDLAEVPASVSNSAAINPISVLFNTSRIKASNLNYIILYYKDGFEALVEYGIEFDENSAVSGVVQKISGSYNQLVQTEKLQNSGITSITQPNGFTVNESHHYTYWIEGVIEDPSDDYAQYRNQKALKIHLKVDKTKTVGKK